MKLRTRLETSALRTAALSWPQGNTEYWLLSSMYAGPCKLLALQSPVLQRLL